MKRVSVVSECIHKDILAWVHYPYSGMSCYAYPRYLLSGEEVFVIDGSMFPDRESIALRITGENSPYGLSREFGEIVVMRINDDSEMENYYYGLGENENKYRGVINPDFAKGKSMVEFTRLSRHAFSNDFIQIVEVKESPSFLKPFSDSLCIVDGAPAPQSKLILLKRKNDDSGKVYGPFEYDFKTDTEFVISAPQSFDFRVASLDIDSFGGLIAVRDKEGEEVARFVPTAFFRELFASQDSSRVSDWISKDSLIDLLGKAVSASEDLSSISKSQIRALKVAARSVDGSAVSDRLDEGRRQKLREILLDVELRQELPGSIVNDWMESIPQEVIAEIVLNEEHYPRFQRKLLDSAGVKARIAEEKKALEAGLVEAEQKIQDAELRLDALKGEISDYEARRNELEEQMRDSKEEELADLEKACQDARQELVRLSEEREREIAQKVQLEEKIESIIRNIQKPIEASGKIIEDQILQKVVAAVSGSSLVSAHKAEVVKYEGFREDQDLLEAVDLVNCVHDYVSDVRGRECSYNDVVNWLICLVQGYITTFVGLPGTGKTSLCQILADSLGLTNPQAESRFVEISVERGWSSHKDYIGYYNPLSSRNEQTNPEVFAAIARLDGEREKEVVAPLSVFLLDEANLSPIEHYWSPFLRACDSFSSKGTYLSLGGERGYSLPSNVRFVATMNFDHTTEALSPRFLDRSWVIMLEPEIVDFDRGAFDDATCQAPVSYDRLWELFGPRPMDEADAFCDDLLNDFLQVCQEYSAAVSPRSQRMIRDYLSVACSLMDTSSRDSQYAPLDYAVAQKVLPMLTGPEERVGGLLRELSSRFSSLTESKKKIDRMIEVGEGSGFYQYFA